MSGRWIDGRRKKEEEEAKAAESAKQAEPVQKAEPEKIKLGDSGAAALSAAYVKQREAEKEGKTAENSWKIASETPEMNTAQLTSVYGATTNAKGQLVPNTNRMSASGMQDAKLRINTEIGGFGDNASLAKTMTDAIDAELATRQKNASTRGEAMQLLGGMTLMGFDGQTINVNTADPATVVRGINSIADDDLRAKAAKAYATLAQTQGSRFYGESTDGVGDFLESANLKHDAYKANADYYRGLFYGDGAHDEEDAQSYLDARQEIEEGNDSDYAKAQLTAALDKAYRGITGATTPSVSSADNLRRSASSESATGGDDAGTSPEEGGNVRPDEEERKDEKKPGFFAGLFGKKDSDFNSDSESELQTNVQEAQPSEAQNQNAETAEKQAEDAQKNTAGEAKTPEVQGPVQQKKPTPAEWMNAPGGPGFGEWAATMQERPSERKLSERTEESETENSTEVRKREARTIGEAAGALLSGEYDSIEGAGKDELDALLEKSALARRVYGTLSSEESAQIAANNTPAEAIAYGSIASNGQKVKTLYDMMMSSAFPDALRGDVMAQIAVWAARAEEMEKNGTLGGYIDDADALPEDQLPLLERLLTTDRQSMAEYNGVFAARDDLLEGQAEMRRAREAQSAQTLGEARTAALRGTASEEQLALVRENAAVSDAAVYGDNGYWTRLTDIGAYFAPDADGKRAFEMSSVKLSLNAQGVIDTGDYETALYDQMGALLEEDTRTALALGMTLEDYYAKTGGMTPDALCERAQSRMERQGATLTEAEIAAADAAFGSGVGAAYALGASGYTGWNQYWADFGTSIYEGKQLSEVQRVSARMQDKYQREYGAMGRTVYRRAIEKAVASGKADSTYGQGILKAMDSAADVYMLGINPEDLTDGLLVNTTAELRQNAEAMQGYMRTHATEGEFRWYNLGTSMVYNGISAGVATAATAATGAALTGMGVGAQAAQKAASVLGFGTGYSVVGLKNNRDEYLNKGYSLGAANTMGMLNTAGDMMANIGTFDAMIRHFPGWGALSGSAQALIKRNPAGAGKALSAIGTLGRAVGEGAKVFAKDVFFDEPVHDETLEGFVEQWVDNGIGPIYRKIENGETLTFTDVLNVINPANIHVNEVMADVKENYWQNAIGAVMFGLAGATGAAASELKSVKLAKEVVSGKSQNVEEALRAAAEDAADAQSAEILNREVEQQRADKATAEEMLLTRDPLDRTIRQAETQAETAKARADAAQTAADSSRAQFDEASEAVMNGDLSRQKEMTEARVRMGENQKIANEQSAVYARRAEETESAFAQRLENARGEASRMLNLEDAVSAAALSEDRQARTAAIDSELAQLDAQDEQLQNAFTETLGGLSDAQEMGMDEDTIAALTARTDEIAERMAALEEARERITDPEAYAARQQAEAEAAQQEQEAQTQMQQQREREHIQSEIDGLAPAVREVAGAKAKRIYLNEQQLAEVLHATGLRTISRVNSEYGTKFRKNRANADVDLDSGFYRELAASIPGLMEAESAHPETAILDLLNRNRELSGMQGGPEASVGKGGAEDYLNADVSRGNLDPVTQKLAAHLKQKTGLELIVMPLGDKTRGFYDRANGRLILSNRLGAGEQMRQVVMHELTHFIEETKGYAAYEDATLEAAYRGDMDALERDAQEIRETYEQAGIACDVNRELVAAATEKLTDALGAWGRTGSETLVYDLLGEKQSFPIRVYNKLTQFLAKRKAQKAGDAAVDHYRALVTARDNLKAAIAEAGQWQKGKGGEDATIELFGKTAPVQREVTRGEQTEMEFSIQQDESNWPMVKADRELVLSKDPKKWNDEIQAYIEKTIRKDGDIQIQTLEGEKLTINEKSQWHAGSRVGYINEKLYRTKLDASAHLDEVAQVAIDQNPGKQNRSDNGKHGSFAQDGWRYYDAVFEDYDGKRYLLNISVAQGDQGHVVYNIGKVQEIEKSHLPSVYAPAGRVPEGATGTSGKETQRTGEYQRTPHSSHAASLSDTSVAQSETGVNPYDTSNGAEYAVAPRQFGNKTAQALDTLTDRTKDFLRGSEYETATNREQVQKANDDINARGIDAVVGDLLARERWTADDHAAAAVAFIRAENEGLMTTAYVIAKAYDEQGTNAGQALQARKIIGKLTAAGALAEATKKADRANAKKGVQAGDIPVGNQAPVKGRKERQQRSREAVERMRKEQTETNGSLNPTGEFDPNNPFNKGSTSVLAQEDVTGARGPAGDAVQGSFIETPLPPILEKVYTAAELMQQKIDSLPADVSDDNPWRLPLESWKTELIDRYKLRGTKLVGDTYSYATVKERMLAAIIATPNNNRGDGLLTLCQQLEAMKQGLAVVTEADLNYIAGQMSTFLYAEGPELEGMPVTTEGKTALQRVYNAQANTVQESTAEKLNNFGYTNMLSSPKTWSKNITSNLLMRPLELASEKIGGMVENALITRRTGNRTTDAPSRAEKAQGRDAFVGEIGQTMVDYFITHADTGHSSSFDLSHNNRTYNNAFLQAYKNIVDFAMQAGDRPFWEQCYAEELAVIKRLGTKIADTQKADGREARGLRDMTPEEMKTEAAVRATERVFQEDNGIVGAINKARQESPMADFAITSMMPFLKTPTNVASRMVQYSPIGLARAVLQYGLWDGTRNGGAKFDQRKFVMNLGRGLTGTGLAAVGCLLAGLGFIKPGREDEEDKKLGVIRKAKGESYSTYLKLGDMEIPLDFAQPASGPLYIGAQIAWGLEQMGEDADVLGLVGDVLYGSALETGNQLFDNSFLSGFAALFRGYNDAAGIAHNIAENVAENQASRLTPSAVRALAKATDPYVRDVYSQNAVKQFFNQQIAQNWPILRQTLPVKTDITGDKTLQSGYYNWGKEQQSAVLHMLNAYVTPWTSIGEKNDATLDELTDLAYRTGETSFLPGELVSGSKYEVTVTKTLAKALRVNRVGVNQYAGMTIHLTDEEKRWLNGTYADALFNGSGRRVTGLRPLTESRKWQRMSDEEKMSAVKEEATKAKQAVLEELVRRKKEAGQIK